MRRSPIERVELLAVEKYGTGASVSVDKVEYGARRYGTSWVVAIWDPKGNKVRQTPTPSSKTDAIAKMRAMLEEP